MKVPDLVIKSWLVVSDAVSSFRDRKGLITASSLAFSSMLALIPALFLLTLLVGMAVGSSQEALGRVQELVISVLPGQSDAIMREVRRLADQPRFFGALNGLILVLAVTPLVSAMRRAFASLFRKRQQRMFLLERLLDVAITVLFLLALAAVAAAGVVIAVLEDRVSLPAVPGPVAAAAPFLLNSATIFLLYRALVRQARSLDLLAGALAAAALWSCMRPLFHLFLEYNPGYGIAFGSFKSLFVVIIWIYYSFVVLLLGAEIAAGLGRSHAVLVRKLVEGRNGLPLSFLDRYREQYGDGEVIFQEGDPGPDMYTVRKGSVAIWKGGARIAVIPEGGTFGEISFLLRSPRVATARAVGEVEVASISSETVDVLMNEFPHLVVKMLRGMARRLREAGTLVD